MLLREGVGVASWEQPRPPGGGGVASDSPRRRLIIPVILDTASVFVHGNLFSAFPPCPCKHSLYASQSRRVHAYVHGKLSGVCEFLFVREFLPQIPGSDKRGQ